MKTEKQFGLPQGILDLLILRVIALGLIHGYTISQRIQQMSCEVLQVQRGSLYPALHRLKSKKLVGERWQRREASFYALTTKGHAYLKDETETWKRLTDIVGLVLKETMKGIS